MRKALFPKYLNIFRQSLFPMRLIRLVTLVSCVATSALASAETVTQKQAQKMAQQFFNQAYKEQTAPVKMVYNGKRLTTDRLFTPFYVYNQPRGGFVIISAENKTFPILGYSLKDNFDPDALTDTEKGWLQSYAHDIELIRYDSRVPEEAIEAWRDYPAYVVNLLDAPYEATDAVHHSEDVRGDLEELLSIDDADSSRDGEYSAFYTPEQWQAMLDSELSKNGEVAIGFVNSKRKLYPGILHGKKGDYYRIEFGRPNNWLMRLMPAEILGERMIAIIGNPRYVAPAEEETPAFEFYDSYSRAHADESFPSTNSIMDTRMSILNDQPMVKSVGGGHFDVVLPENARLAMLYNIQGSHLGRATYGGSSPIAHINLEGEPQGFYLALIFGESGKAYGVKLYR
ncbi:MAG: Spi family protease inhibitor [Muribaculaceae bacterium]|nr:Spi family protease inhibitor [Muribaculaceae bacterium]